MGQITSTFPGQRTSPRVTPFSRTAATHRPSAIFWITCFSAAIHLAVTLLFVQLPIALDDMFQYDMLARSIAQGTGYRWYTRPDVDILWPYYSQFLTVSKDAFPAEGLLTTFRAPGYPLFLSLIYLMAGMPGRIFAARLVQAVLFSGLTWVVYHLARTAAQSERAARSAAICMAIYPILLAYPIGLASENFFIPLLVLGVLTTIRASGQRQAWSAVAAGLLLGLASLTRSIAAPCVVVCAGWLVLSAAGQWKKALGKAAALATCAGLVCLPWAIRNTLVLGHPAMVENSLGYNLYVGYHPDGNGEFISEIAIPPLNILDDGQRDTICTEQALGFIRADPAEALGRVARRAAAFFGPEDREFRFFYTNNFTGPIPQPWLGMLYVLLVLPWFFTLFFAVAGLLASPNRRAAVLVMLVAGLYVLPHLLILAEPRFHLALVPILLPYAAYGWLERKNIFKKILSPRAAGQAELWIARAAWILLLGLWVWGACLRLAWLPALMSAGGNLLRQAY